MFERCPRSWIRDEASEAAQTVNDVLWFHRYGQPPDDGGRLDQDPRWLDAVAIVDQEVAAANGKRSKKGCRL